eukprot:1148820-Pelagomonas_calceolata.AAC.5
MGKTDCKDECSPVTCHVSNSFLQSHVKGTRDLSSSVIDELLQALQSSHHLRITPQNGYAILTPRDPAVY